MPIDLYMFILQLKLSYIRFHIPTHRSFAANILNIPRTTINSYIKFGKIFKDLYVFLVPPVGVENITFAPPIHKDSLGVSYSPYCITS